MFEVKKDIKLLAVGDIALDFKGEGNPFTHVISALKDKDILFGNLETTISDNKGTPLQKGWIFKAPTRYVTFLKGAGFDVLNVANNHILDFGNECLIDTMKTLESNDIAYVGAGENFTEAFKPQIIAKNKLRVGFTGYYFGATKYNILKKPVVAGVNKRAIIKQIKRLKKQDVNIVIVSLHWGYELIFYPSPERVKFYRKLIDAGATVVLGHHPHVIQGMERYKHGLIAYSLGNFQIVNSETREKKGTDQSIILSVEIGKEGVRSYNVIPVKLDNNFIPRIARENECEEILNLIAERAQPIGTNEFCEKWFNEVIERYCSRRMKEIIMTVKKIFDKTPLKNLEWFILPLMIRVYIGLSYYGITR